MSVHLHLDPFSGVSGDMLLGALVDVGGPAGVLQEVAPALGLEGVAVEMDRRSTAGLDAVVVTVRTEGTPPERRLTEVRATIEGSRLDLAVRRRALAVFERLAAAEARAHGVGAEAVHFHEVGADDALVDIVGACALWAELGVESASCGPIALGGGVAEGAHGPLPVPAPATAYLFEGFETYGGPEPLELATPTGAAIVATLCEPAAAQPRMRLERSGYGAGSAATEGLPNVLRAMLGRLTKPPGARLALLETNLDDSTPEQVAFAVERLLEVGARDA